MDIQSIRQNYPEYSDLSDADLAKGLHQKFYADLPFDQFAQKIGLPQPAAPSMLDQFGRQAGLTARYAIEGMAGVPAMFIDPFQRLAGVRTMSQGVSSLLDRAGLPKPEGDAEQYIAAISKAGAGAGGFIGAAKSAPAIVSQVVKGAPPLVTNVLAAAPAAQLAQSAVGAGASEAVRQGGGNEWEQLLAGAVGSVAAGGVGSVAAAAKRGARELARPVTFTGSEQVAADTLGRIVGDKTSALANLRTYLDAKAAEAAGGPRVGSPGFAPTTAMASGDVGIAGAARTVARGDANPQFAAREAANNSALLDDLARLRSTDSWIARKEQVLEKRTAPMREAALDPANAKGPVNYDAVADKIGEIAATPAGGRVESDRALKWLTDRLEWYASHGRDDAANAYALYKDIGDLVAGRVSDGKGGAVRLAGGLANQVKKALGDAIEAAAPGFKAYLDEYHGLSNALDRLKALNTRLGSDLERVTNASVVSTGQEPRFALSQAKMRNALADLSGNLNASRSNQLSLSPFQRDVLERVQGNLNARNFAETAGKLPGSDTYQNMATANFLRQMLGDTLAESGVLGAARGPVNLLMRPIESRVNNLLVEALLNPDYAYRLLQMARTSRASPTLAGVAQQVGTGANMGLLGAAISQ